MESPIWIKIWTGWAIILAMLTLFFLVVEALALIRPGTGDTLSETVWYLRDSGNGLYWFILDVIVLVGVTCGWLLFHFRWQSGRSI